MPFQRIWTNHTPASLHTRLGDLANSSAALLSLFRLFLFFLLWLANQAALQAMDQPFPPRPALLRQLMLMLNPTRSK